MVLGAIVMTGSPNVVLRHSTAFTYGMLIACKHLVVEFPFSDYRSYSLFAKQTLGTPLYLKHLREPGIDTPRTILEWIRMIFG